MSPDENEMMKPSATVNSRIKRCNERDRQRSIEYEKMKKEDKYWEKEDKILFTHIPYNDDVTKSPHILINKWFHRLKNMHCSQRSTGGERKEKSENILRNRFCWCNIKYTLKRNFFNLQLENTKQKWVMILIRFSDIMFNLELSFFSESGFSIQEDDISKNSKGYVFSL